MRVISYDIGIKNLAYCILEYTANPYKISILDWNIINLLEKEQVQVQCSQTIPGNKKQSSRTCQCSAKFQKNNEYYCLKHAKKSNYILPTKKHTKTYLKKLKVGELQQLSSSLFLYPNGTNSIIKKDELIDIIFEFYQKQCLEPIIEKKMENAGDTDLILIGKRMKDILNNNDFTETITHVVIENQISPIATRMKTLQGMLTQYYIDKNSDLVIEFVSSVHKLKQFAGKPSVNQSNMNTEKLKGKKPEKLENVLNPQKDETVQENSSKKGSDKAKYKLHKDSGIMYCSQIIENNHCFEDWKSKLDTKKKDDLADCFLQGLWYFKHKNIINYADDLKINIV